MFRKEYIDDVRQNLQTLNDNKKKVIFLQKRLADLEKRKAEIDKFLELAQRAYMSSGEDRDATMFTKGMAAKILAEEAMIAISGTEFDLPEFRTGLLTAIFLPQTITFGLRKSNEVLDANAIQINLKQTAGRISDYASAVRRARKILGVGQSRRVGKGRFSRGGVSMATWFWREKYYGPAREGKTIPQPIYKEKKTPTGRTRKKRNYNTEQYKENYFKTIATRISLFGDNLAPWWQLLDRGNPAGFTGAKEGEHDLYPQNKATNFVQKALTRMRREAQKNRGVNYADLNESDQLKAINDLFTARSAIESAIEYIQSILDNIDRAPLKRETVLEEIERRLGLRLAKADKTKVERIIADFELQAKVPERIRLGGGVRIRTIEIQRILRARGGR